MSELEKPNISSMLYRIVEESESKIYDFDGVHDPSVRFVDLAEVDLSEGGKVARLDVTGPVDLSGDVTAQFTPAEPHQFFACKSNETAAAMEGPCSEFAAGASRAMRAGLAGARCVTYRILHGFLGASKPASLRSFRIASRRPAEELRKHRLRCAKTSVALMLASMVLTGCAIQADVIQARHWDLNEMLRETTNEQLLLNIVRLRYDETPYFLQIASVTTSFAAGANAGAQATLPDGAPDVFGLSAGVSYSEAPTVTWGLPDSREMLGRLHAPMGADELTVLTQAGLDPETVLRIGAKKINRLRNAEFNLERGIFYPDSYDAFIEMLNLLGTLSREGVVDLSYGVYSTSGGGKIPLARLDTRAMAEALPSGMQFMTRDDPNVFEPLKLSKPLFLKFTSRSDHDPRAQRLRDLLDLDPARHSFAIIDTANSGTEQLLSESGRISRVLDDTAPLREIVVNNRSVMEVLRFASAYVDVPFRDLSAGVVRERTPPARDWLKVEVANARPAHAWLAVERDGFWYYIRDDNLESRINFTVLNALFASVVGEVPGAKPLLTLPVK